TDNQMFEVNLYRGPGNVARHCERRTGRQDVWLTVLIQGLDDGTMNSGRVMRARRKEIDQKDVNASLECGHGLADQFFDVWRTILVRRRHDLDQGDQSMPTDMPNCKGAAPA